MSAPKKKLSLLNDLDNIIENENNILRTYCFLDIGKIIVNGIDISVPSDVVLHIILKNGYMKVKFFDGSKLLFKFKIECKLIDDLHLLMRGE